MSELTARNLRSRGATIAAVANRTAAHGEQLADRVGARAIGLDEIGELLAEADVVVSSTSAPGFVLDASTVAGRRSAAGEGRPLLFVDLAVPRDIDPALAAIDGCFVYDIDDLEAVVVVARRRRARPCGPSGSSRPRRSVFGSGRRHCRRAGDRVAVRPRGGDPRAASWRRRKHGSVACRRASAELVEAMTSQIVAKLLHLPTVRMKEAAAAADGVVYADVVRHLFGLGEEEQRVTRPSSTGRPLPLQAPDCVRPHPPAGPSLCGEPRTDDPSPVLLRVGSRGSRLALTQAERAARGASPAAGSRSRSFRSRRPAIATARARSARSAPAASSSRSSRRRCSTAASTSPCTRRRT